MKRSLLRLTATTLVATILIASGFAQQINWRSSFESGLSEGKRSGKLTMVFLHADWCTFCQNMKRTTLKEASTAKTLQAVIPVMLNVEKEGASFKSKYKIVGLPAFVFVEPNGKIFGSLEGFVPGTLYRDEVTKFTSAFKARPELLAAFKRDPKSGEVNARLAWMFGIQRDLPLALKHLDIAERARYKGAHMARALSMIGDYYQLSDRHETAVSYFKRALTASLNPADKSYALVSLVSCYRSLKKPDLAKKYAIELVNLKGATPEYIDFAQAELRKGNRLEIERKVGFRSPDVARSGGR